MNRPIWELLIFSGAQVPRPQERCQADLEDGVGHEMGRGRPWAGTNQPCFLTATPVGGLHQLVFRHLGADSQFALTTYRTSTQDPQARTLSPRSPLLPRDYHKSQVVTCTSDQLGR